VPGEARATKTSQYTDTEGKSEGGDWKKGVENGELKEEESRKKRKLKDRGRGDVWKNVGRESRCGKEGREKKRGREAKRENHQKSRKKGPWEGEIGGPSTKREKGKTGINR